MTRANGRATILASTVPRILPVLERPFRTVLDLGCGTSNTLRALALPADAIRVGLDVDLESLKAAQSGADGVRLAAADGHRLPFRSDSFDLVVSKVTLPYLNIPVALRELHRVTRAGGVVWLTLHPFAMTAMRIWGDLKSGNIRDAIYQGYAVLNGLLLGLSGRQFAFPLNRRRIESFQTVKGITRALRDAGFSDVRFELRSRGPGHEASDRRLGKVFAVSAQKRA